MLEIIQNINDSKFEETPHLLIEINKENQYIIFASNEIGFSAKDIRSICNISSSSKKEIITSLKSEENVTYGQKGIGFK